MILQIFYISCLKDTTRHSLVKQEKAQKILPPCRLHFYVHCCTISKAIFLFYEKYWNFCCHEEELKLNLLLFLLQVSPSREYLCLTWHDDENKLFFFLFFHSHSIHTNSANSNMFSSLPRSLFGLTQTLHDSRCMLLHSQSVYYFYMWWCWLNDLAAVEWEAMNSEKTLHGNVCSCTTLKVGDQNRRTWWRFSKEHCDRLLVPIVALQFLLIVIVVVVIAIIIYTGRILILLWAWNI